MLTLILRANTYEDEDPAPIVACQQLDQHLVVVFE